MVKLLSVRRPQFHRARDVYSLLDSQVDVGRIDDISEAHAFGKRLELNAYCAIIGYKCLVFTSSPTLPSWE